MSSDIATIIVDGGVWDRVLYGDLSDTGLALDGTHQMVSSGSKRTILGIRTTLLLSEGSFPWMQTIIKPATITEVLLEMVDGNDTDLARKAVMNLFFNLFFDAFSKFLYVFCVHRHYLGIAVKSAISRK